MIHRSNRIALAIVAIAAAGPAAAQLLADATDPLTQLSRMSLEELARVEVTSVSK